jgi:hypothetical protein
MKRSLSTLLLFVSATLSASAGTLTNIDFSFNSPEYRVDTIVNATAPLAFINVGNTGNPFLNNPDSTISLGYGTYYAIATFVPSNPTSRLAGNPVSIALVVDGASFVSQIVNFPPSSTTSGAFATINLPGGETVTLSATALTADRVRVAIDGSGLVGDGSPDTFYFFTYAPANAIPEPATIWLSGTGLAALAVARKRR